MSLPGYAWLDEDGRHVWSEHSCVTGDVVTMLPSIWRAVDGKVEPSVRCTCCGYHAFPLIGPERANPERTP